MRIFIQYFQVRLPWKCTHQQLGITVTHSFPLIGLWAHTAKPHWVSPYTNGISRFVSIGETFVFL